MPRRFTFRLQPVLEQRERDEEREQLRVAEIERQRLAAEQNLRDIQSEFNQTRMALREHLLRPTNRPDGGSGHETPAGISGIRGLATDSLHLTLRAQRAAMELAGVLRRLEGARADLLRAAAARKAVALLRERALAEYLREAQRREAAELDELMVMRHARADDATMSSILDGSSRL